MVNRLSDLIIGHYERHAAAWDAEPYQQRME